MKARRPGAYEQRVRTALAALGVTSEWIRARRLTLQPEARRLAPVGLGPDGRDKFLAPAAARAWRALHRAAARDGVQLELLSGFRSLDFQLALIEGKRQKGRNLDEVLTVNAPPGYSEHHTGKALDLGTPGCPALDERFETTPAFAWLRRNAQRHGFSLSYPRGNRQGFLYEPWHWRFG